MSRNTKHSLDGITGALGELCHSDLDPTLKGFIKGFSVFLLGLFAMVSLVWAMSGTL